MTLIDPDQSDHPDTSVDQLYGFELRGASAGRSSAIGRIPVAQVHHGWLGPLADLAAATTFIGTLPEGMTCITSGLRIDCVGVAPQAGEVLTAYGQLLDSHNGLALATCQIHRGDGSLMANVVGRFISADGPSNAAGYAQRTPMQGEAELVSAVRMERRTKAVADGRYVFSHLLSFAYPLGVVHGGVQMTLAELAVRDWLTADLHRPNMGTLDIDVRYLRPLSAEGDHVTLDFQAQRTGKRIVSIAGTMRSSGSGDIATAFGVTLSE